LLQGNAQTFAGNIGKGAKHNQAWIDHLTTPSTSSSQKKLTTLKKPRRCSKAQRNGNRNRLRRLVIVFYYPAKLVSRTLFKFPILNIDFLVQI